MAGLAQEPPPNPPPKQEQLTLNDQSEMPNTDQTVANPLLPSESQSQQKLGEEVNSSIRSPIERSPENDKSEGCDTDGSFSQKVHAVSSTPPLNSELKNHPIGEVSERQQYVTSSAGKFDPSTSESSKAPPQPHQSISSSLTPSETSIAPCQLRNNVLTNESIRNGPFVEAAVPAQPPAPSNSANPLIISEPYIPPQHQQLYSAAQNHCNFNNNKRKASDMEPQHPPTWQQPQPRSFNVAQYVPHYNFRPTWNQMFAPVQTQQQNANTMYELSLMNVHEFTVTPSHGLRRPIRSICKSHGVAAVYENDKWRIPLAAYQDLVAYLGQNVSVPIDERELNLAMVERTRQAKPSVSCEYLIKNGVPAGLAEALAVFQRDGVDFVLSKEGKALIADDMGLGKTIQSIASMACYRQDWPILVLSPSGARYHWQAEFLHWLGRESKVNKEDRCTSELLTKENVHVLTSGSVPIFPNPNTKIVICSYGLIVKLIENKSIVPGQFPCAIVDESHMLKNMQSQRTSALIPVLRATRRCVLLSGTPALARPLELWPQLYSLDQPFWSDADEYVRKFVKSTKFRAQLHALLTGTVMIRRLKADVLDADSLKPKQRQLAHVEVDMAVEEKDELAQLLDTLRQGKGALGKMARKVEKTKKNSSEPTNEEKIAKLRKEMENEYARKAAEIQQGLWRYPPQAQPQLMAQLLMELRTELDAKFQERRARVNEASSRARVLTRLYSLTGNVKIPLVVRMLKQWLGDPTKGKLCIFAHHLDVLDAIREQTELENYIRIDGKVSPKSRQEQITAFQTDPSIRVALLGITAAGVAVTLTAASTVWFAELFWTPALMIQAEDRCHRIGQQAQVKSLYLVAKGTLDEVLWKLIMAKFRALGEFVEGKEEQKIVVNHTFRTVEELQSLFRNYMSDEDDEDYGEPHEIDGSFDLQSADVIGEIAMFGEEERQMLRDGEEDDGGQNPEERKSPDVVVVDNEESTAGKTENSAICLDDSDDEEKKSEPMTSNASRQNTAFDACLKCTLSNPRIFKMTFDGPSIGIELTFHKYRAVVSRISPGRVAQLGPDAKPALGDIVVGVNSVQLPLVKSLEQLLVYIQQCMKLGPVLITFCEDKDFAESFVAYRAATKKAPPKPPTGPDNVIEID